MQITAYIERENKERIVELEEQATVEKLLEKLKINPETVLVVKNEEVLLKEVKLEDKDTIKILSVVSGG
jgi:thiamine biosynthesis protein ThiS|tara:strand:- start:32636 stop:32842 length:207 start_codon:yes stop_codon:yes gene_type:complete